MTSDFIFNGPDEVQVLSTIKNELIECDEFYISVAFITDSGITPLLQDLKELEEKGVKGKIITTDYLCFTQPKAIKRLNDLENVTVKMYRVNDLEHGFHTKGYIFKHDAFYNIIIGSSNLTQKALTINKEWNILTKSELDGPLYYDVIEEFNRHWDEALLLEECIDDYEIFYDENKDNAFKFQESLKNEEEFTPNEMQKDFTKRLVDFYENGEKRALLISATGTGKTYASAFALKEINPGKALFLVHREQIAKQALETYKNVFKDTKTFGLISGNKKDYDKDFIFSTIQSMSKEHIHSKFSKTHFDFIVIDESHHAGAETYQRVMDYFKPEFYLGMTASPDRSDDFDIYELFHHNIAYEIRLQDALKEDMLCPFHYFGISDIITLDDAEIREKDEFNNLTSDERVKHIIQKAEYFGYSGNRVKGLIFCSRKDVASELSEKFNKAGYNTVSLAGEDNQQVREEAIDRLVSDTRPDTLDYIFTVDIFNEGVDIPEINQIIMLRPTESTIIFLQQLGRGLRKVVDKDYVVIIDFIGNYDKNFLIPMALSGDRTGIKDNHRKWLNGGDIPGVSSVSFDKISKERIINSINKSNLSRLNYLKNFYMNLKFKLGRVPSFNDFYEFGDIDPLVIINYIKKSIKPYKTYYNFIKKVDKDYEVVIDDEFILEYLQFMTLKLAYSKRPHELIILRELSEKGWVSINSINDILSKEFNINNDYKSIYNAIDYLDKKFDVTKDLEKYPNVNFFIKEGDIFSVSYGFRKALSNKIFLEFFNDIVEYGLKQYLDKFHGQTSGVNLKLYEKYSRYDVCRLLNWPHDDSSTLYGYRIKHGTCPIFVTYDKEEDISESTKYEDVFIDNETFSWMTRSNVKLDSKEPVEIMDYEDSGLVLHLFIKKSDDEGHEFYYIGPVIPRDPKQKTIMNDKGKELPIVNFKLDLKYPVREDVYNYLSSKLGE